MKRLPNEKRKERRKQQEGHRFNPNPGRFCVKFACFPALSLCLREYSDFLTQSKEMDMHE